MTAVLTLVALLFPAQRTEPWTWSQRVEYQDNHDPSMVWLRDGRRLQPRLSRTACATRRAVEEEGSGSRASLAEFPRRPVIGDLSRLRRARGHDVAHRGRPPVHGSCPGAGVKAGFISGLVTRTSPSP